MYLMFISNRQTSFGMNFIPSFPPTSTRLPHATERRTGRFSAAAGPVPRAAPMPKLTDFMAFFESFSGYEKLFSFYSKGNRI